MPATKVVRVLPDSELGQRLKAAETSGEPVVVDTGEAVYTLLVRLRDAAPEQVFSHYDPQAAIRGLQALEGALSGVDRHKLLTDLKAQ